MSDVLLSDIDGTLVDSNALHAEAWRRAFEHFGIEVGIDEAWSQIGKGGDQLIPVFVPEADRERLEPEIKEFRKEVFHRDYMPRIVSFAKARELLVRVKKSGRRIVLATSSSDLQGDRGHGGPGRGRGNERGCAGFEAGAGYFCRRAEKGGGGRGGGDCAGGYSL